MTGLISSPQRSRAWMLLARAALVASLCWAGLAPGEACGQLPLLSRDTDTAPKPALETDRDSFTPATSVVGPRQIVMESSYSFIDNRTGADAHSFPELLVRRGITERSELRLGWNYEAGGPTGAVSGSDFGDQTFEPERVSEFLYGAKYLTTRQSGWQPESSVIVEGFSPTSGPSNYSRFVLGEVWGWDFANGWQWNTTIRYGTAKALGDHFCQWAPSTVLKVPVGARWNVHIEYFGAVTSGTATFKQSQQYISFGGHVLLTEDLELGGRFGFGLNEQTPTFFNNVGIGLRF